MRNKQQRLAELEAEAAKLKAEIEEEEKQYRAWEPEPWEGYWFINGELISETYHEEGITDLAYIEIGNCFKAKEEAKEYKKWLTMLTTIRKYAKKANQGWEPSGRDYGCGIYVDNGVPDCCWVDDKTCILPNFNSMDDAQDCIKLYDNDTWVWLFNYLQKAA